MKGTLKEKNKQVEITFEVERDQESGWFVASWDAPRGQGGITTQGRDLRELEQNVREAVRCHFENGRLPRQIRLHFLQDPLVGLCLGPCNTVTFGRENVIQIGHDQERISIVIGSRIAKIARSAKIAIIGKSTGYLQRRGCGAHCRHLNAVI